MKIVLGVIVIMSLAQPCVFSQIIAPGVIKSVDSSSAQTDILGILDKMKTNADDPGEVNDLIHELNSKWDYYVRFSVSFESSFRHEVIKRLIEFYDSIGPDGDKIDFANKVRILEFVGPRDNSPETHTFYLREMDTSDADLQEYVLRSIGGKVGVKGNDIYNKIKELVAKGGLSEFSSLRYLKAADEMRAKNEIREFIIKTTDLDEYRKAGQLLSTYLDPELLDVLATRYPDFRHKPRTSFGDNPAFAFTFEMMRRYIEYASGEKLVRALEIASDADTFGNEELPLLQRKLHDNTIVGREAVLDFILLKTKTGYASRDNVLRLLKDAVNYETNPEIRKKITAGIKVLEQRK